MKALNENSEYFIREVSHGEKSAIKKVNMADILILFTEDKTFEYVPFGEAIHLFSTFYNWCSKLNYKHIIGVTSILMIIIELLRLFQ